jgi:hypothetical protein
MFGLAVVLVGCATKQAEVRDKLYFDLEGYIAGEIDRMVRLDTCVTKTVSIGGSAETHTFPHADTTFWQREMTLFIEADINAPAYRDLYTISRQRSGTDSMITFETASTKPATRWLKVWKRGDAVVRIEAQQRANNFVYTTLHDLVYVPDSGYHMASTQKAQGAPTRNFKIDGRLGCSLDL